MHITRDTPPVFQHPWRRLSGGLQPTVETARRSGGVARLAQTGACGGFPRIKRDCLVDRTGHRQAYSETDGLSFRIGRLYVLNWTEGYSELDGRFMAKGKSVLSRDGFVQRHAEPKVIRVLADTRVTAIVGPRQSGKTTLARRIADRDGRSFITLDDAQYRWFADHDPDGFMRGLEYAVIDEIQRAPDLILAIKKAVDEDPRPGRYLMGLISNS